MAIIHSYPGGEPESGDKLIVTDAAGKKTKSVSVDSLVSYVNDTNQVAAPVYTPITDELIAAGVLADYYNDKEAPKFTSATNTPYYGPIENWDVSQVTNMDGMFSSKTIEFDLSLWNTGNVTSMLSMFDGAAFVSDFMLGLSTWDMSNVTTTSGMFTSSNFNGDISDWDTSKVTNMSNMFYDASAFNQDINSWDVSKVTNMRFMFAEAGSFNRDLNSWDVSRVTSTQQMFSGATLFNGNINSWDTSKIISMFGMFDRAESFNKSLSNWDVSKVVNMRSMFEDALSFNADISYWDVSNVTDMSYMFNGASAFYRDISSWNVPKINERPTSFTASSPNISLEPVWGVNKLEGHPRAEGVEIADIVNDKDLTTKEYVNSVLPIITVDQGNGEGHVLAGRDEAMYGNVGNGAVDLSSVEEREGTPYEGDTSGNFGAIGEMSFASGKFNTSSGWGSFSTGYNNKAIGDVSAAYGHTNEARGFSSATYGTYNVASANYSFASGISNSSGGWWSHTLGAGLITKTGAAVAVGCSNTDYDTTGMQFMSSNNPMFIVGNGTLTNANASIDGGNNPDIRSDALIVYRSGKIIAPSLDISLITEGKDLTTKEYVDSNAGGSGYSHTGAFADKPSTNDRVWQAGEGVNYTQIDVDAELWKVFSINEAVHLEVDNPYWSDPAPTGVKGIGLFEGEHLPEGVSSLVDYDYSYDNQHFIYTNKITSSNDCISIVVKNGVSRAINFAGISGANTASRYIFSNNTGTIQENIQVHPGSSYTFRFYVKADASTPSFNPAYSLRDLSNGTNLIEGTTFYSSISTSDWTPIERTFTAPVGCYEVALRFATANNTSGILYVDSPQFNDGSSIVPYVSTSGVAARNAVITHGYYHYNSGTTTGYENSTGRIKLNDIRVGDQLRVRFDFNITPQIPNTTVEPALWYSNRDANDQITYSFPLTTQPIFYGSGTVGNTFLNRPEISAWITSEEDINALALPAIKSDNPVKIQPLGLLITIIR